MQEDEEEDVPGEADVPANAGQAAGEALVAHSSDRGLNIPEGSTTPKTGGRLSKLAKSAIFREVVLAKVREMKEQEAQKEFERTASEQITKK
jgi:calcium/calmodulin-dependent protein kinase I